MLISATHDKAFLIANTKENQLQIGSEIILENDDARVDTPNELFGNVIDIFGNIILPYPEKTRLSLNASGRKVFELAWFNVS
nr:hypothetical protein [Mycoplasmopsis cynos]